MKYFDSISEKWVGAGGATRTLLACTSACVLQVQPQNVAQLEFTGFRTEVFYTFLACAAYLNELIYGYLMGTLTLSLPLFLLSSLSASAFG